MYKRRGYIEWAVIENGGRRRDETGGQKLYNKVILYVHLRVENGGEKSSFVNRRQL